MKHFQQAEFIERAECINCGSTSLAELARGNFSDQPLRGFIADDPWGENPTPFLKSAFWVLSKCNECTQVFHKRVLNEEWNERRFTKWMSADAIRAFEARLGPMTERRFLSATNHVNHILRIERLTRQTRRQDEAVRLLDFGCGFGEFLEACHHFGFDACGVDRSVGRRDGASVKVFPHLENLPQKQFHAITMFEVLEHLDHPSQMLEQLSTYLIDGGLLILETPDCSGVTDIKSLYDFRKIDPLEHINAFVHDTLKSIAERQGFRQIGRGPSYVTAETRRVIKRFAKHALRRDGKSTQLYFLKT